MPKKSDDLFDRTITVTEAAALIQRTPRHVQGLVERGLLKKNQRGRYALKAVIAAEAENLRQQAEAARSRTGGNRASDARAREIELRIAERQRDLIPAEDAKAAVVHVCALVKAELTGLPARFTRDPAEKRRLEAEVDAMLHRIADAAEVDDGD